MNVTASWSSPLPLDRTIIFIRKTPEYSNRQSRNSKDIGDIWKHPVKYCAIKFLRSGFINLKKWFIEKTGNSIVQFFRYFFVGGIAFFVDFGILYGLTLTLFFKTYYIFAATISFILALSVNYYLSVIWVFDRRNIRNRFLEFLAVAFIGTVGLGLNIVLIWLFTDILFVFFINIPDKQMRIMISKIIASVIATFWNFAGRKIFVFSKHARSAAHRAV